MMDTSQIAMTKYQEYSAQQSLNFAVWYPYHRREAAFAHLRMAYEEKYFLFHELNKQIMYMTKIFNFFKGNIFL